MTKGLTASHQVGYPFDLRSYFIRIAIIWAVPVFVRWPLYNCITYNSRAKRSRKEAAKVAAAWV